MSVPVNISIGVTGITDYLLVIVRKVSAPTIEATRQSFGPAPTAVNASFDLDPVTYNFDFRNSVDGTAIGTLIATYVVDAASNQIISEKRYYTCDGGGTYDPAPGATTIVDPYFIGKNISAVFKEGFRYLIPTTEWTFAVDTVEVINGTAFDTSEVFIVEITYKSSINTITNSTEFEDIQTLTADTVLDSTYYNNKLKLASAAATLLITLPSIATVPDGKFYFFQSFGGLQKQTRILCDGIDKIFFDGFQLGTDELSEIWVAKGEYLKLVKEGTYWEVERSHKGLTMVGEKFVASYKDHPTAGIENGTLYDGDEYPRIYWWIKNVLAANNKIVDDTVTSGLYVHPADSVGKFVVHSTLKKFRLPNTQGLFQRGLADFVTYGGDVANRPVDAPGGYQADTMKQTTFTVVFQTTKRGSGGDPDQATGRDTGGGTFGAPWNKSITVPGAAEVRVKNEGVIYSRRF